MEVKLVRAGAKTWEAVLAGNGADTPLRNTVRVNSLGLTSTGNLQMLSQINWLHQTGMQFCKNKRGNGEAQNFVVFYSLLWHKDTFKEEEISWSAEKLHAWSINFESAHRNLTEARCEPATSKLSYLCSTEGAVPMLGVSRFFSVFWGCYLNPEVAGSNPALVNFSLFIQSLSKNVPSQFPLWFITWYL